MPDFSLNAETYSLSDLLEIMRYLTGEQGCPWDRKQTHRSLRSYLIEESWEAVEAIEQNDPANLCEELGDVLMQIVFHAVLAERNQDFDLNDVVTGICKKMIRRHTHVFAGETASDAASVNEIWERNKAQEKPRRNKQGLAADLPESLPQLLRASTLLRRAANKGWYWPDAESALAKVVEEAEECAAAKTPEEREEEAGDLLFAAIAATGSLQVDPVLALQKANTKFAARFDRMTAIMEESNQTEQADRSALWEQAKKDIQNEVR